MGNIFLGKNITKHLKRYLMDVLLKDLIKLPLSERLFLTEHFIVTARFEYESKPIKGSKKIKINTARINTKIN